MKLQDTKLTLKIADLLAIEEYIDKWKESGSHFTKNPRYVKKESSLNRFLDKMSIMEKDLVASSGRNLVLFRSEGWILEIIAGRGLPVRKYFVWPSHQTVDFGPQKTPKNILRDLLMHYGTTLPDSSGILPVLFRFRFRFSEFADRKRKPPSIFTNQINS